MRAYAITAASSGSTSTQAPLESRLKLLRAESSRQVLSVWFTASKRACRPTCNCSGETGNSPASFTVHALPMVSPLSNVKGNVSCAAQPASKHTDRNAILIKLLR
jgi:hypothetical protein